MNYYEYMDRTVVPWLNEHCVHEYIESTDGIQISTYRAVNPDAKGSIVIVHGFCEFFAKYQEAMYRFYEQGYSVFFAELRGYGLSQRTRQFDDERVFVSSFDEYADDVHCFMEKIVLPAGEGKPLYLLAHSMGGAVSALFLERYPKYFCKAVLSAPMLKMNFPADPAWKDGEAMASAVGVFTGVPDFEHSSMLDYDRYMRLFELRRKEKRYQTWGATLAWCAAAAEATEQLQREINQIECPVLIMQAGKDHLVSPEGHAEAAEHNPKISIRLFPDSRHEIYNSTEEDREAWYSEILEFYQA